jgi:hypothetical protein
VSTFLSFSWFLFLFLRTSDGEHATNAPNRREEENTKIITFKVIEHRSITPGLTGDIFIGAHNGNNAILSSLMGLAGCGTDIYMCACRHFRCCSSGGVSPPPNKTTKTPTKLCRSAQTNELPFDAGVTMLVVGNDGRFFSGESSNRRERVFLFALLKKNTSVHARPRNMAKRRHTHPGDARQQYESSVDFSCDRMDPTSAFADLILFLTLFLVVLGSGASSNKLTSNPPKTQTHTRRHINIHSNTHEGCQKRSGTESCLLLDAKD